MKQLSRSVEVPHALKSQAAHAVQVLSQKSLKHGHGLDLTSFSVEEDNIPFLEALDCSLLLYLDARVLLLVFFPSLLFSLMPSCLHSSTHTIPT